ncbi:MAG: efflux RND transporter periplasmic adaptor subunit [Ruminiclostridium sp.]|nr:efflux RND transporter periplasmic adaptor subunit [Ruminiclostridium sp.]
MKKRFLPLLALFSLFLLLPACSDEDTEPESTATPVEIQMVERGTISAETRVSGQVTPGTQENVFVAQSLRCEEVYVELGDAVTAGQVLCKLDASSAWSNYDMAVMSYQMAIDAYNSQSNSMGAEVEELQAAFDEALAQYELGEVTQAALDAIGALLETAMASMGSSLSQLEISIKSAEASVAQMETAMMNIDRNGYVTAPMSGNVTSLNMAANAFVSPSAPLAVIESANDKKIYTSVSEALIPKLAVGDTVNVTVSSLGKTFPATISAMDKASNYQTRLFGVTIQVPQAETGNLFSGMFADVTFYTDTQENVILVPTESIQTGTDGQYVYTVDDQNITHMVPVQTGLVGDGITEITYGLAGGERLVTVGQFYLTDGAEVRIVSAEV